MLTQVVKVCICNFLGTAEGIKLKLSGDVDGDIELY